MRILNEFFESNDTNCQVILSVIKKYAWGEMSEIKGVVKIIDKVTILNPPVISEKYSIDAHLTLLDAILPTAPSPPLQPLSSKKGLIVTCPFLHFTPLLSTFGSATAYPQPRMEFQSNHMRSSPR